MKKICFLVDSIFSFGGVQRVTAVIAKALAKNYDVTIVTFDAPSTKDTTLYKLEETDIHYRFFQFPKSNHLKWKCSKIYSALYRKILPQTQLTSKWYSHSSFLSEKRNALIQELQKGNYDVIIGVHAPLAVRLAACKPYLGETKLIGWIHNSYEALFGEKSLYVGSELRKYYEYQLEKLHHTIVLCQYDARRYHFPTMVIYNPLTLTPGNLSTGNSKKFLAVGRFSRQHKGFDLLIKAFHLFTQQQQEWTLDIVGEGVEESLYRQMIREYGLQDRITIHPFTDHIQSYYSNAQIYVLSSRWEGFGLVLVEAMAHGLPIVSSDLPTSKEIMGDFGLYFENENVEQLAQQLNAATQLDWQKKSQEALEITKRFDLDTIIQQWEKLIEG
ncbi:MAG: glycosyltransferase [Paludibacteraceae bacterium]|nr:glycosyltransferase [Paludibacteraceae bacterium]MBQ8715648.1 glycosyltransferase [Prevotella sp.]